jgi:aspartate/methionine/tyrosine aminotransferase
VALATRLENLGTETAFAVSMAAAEWAAKGNKVYPFHLGDLNLPTPSNVVRAMNAAIADGKTGYCAAAGIAPLREALADDVGARRGLTYAPANVVVQTGGKPVITKFIQTVMNPGDEVLYPNPGYPIYESQIEYFGGVAKAYRYLPTPTGFSIDIEQIRSLITPKTKAICRIRWGANQPTQSVKPSPSWPSRTTFGCFPMKRILRCVTPALRSPSRHFRVCKNAPSFCTRSPKSLP